MKMTLKELDVFTSTVERIKLAVESSLDKCSEVVKKDLTERLEAFNDLWNTTKSQTESGIFCTCLMGALFISRMCDQFLVFLIYTFPRNCDK